MIGPSLPSRNEVYLAFVKARHAHLKSESERRAWWGKTMWVDAVYDINDEPAFVPAPIGWRFGADAFDRLLGSLTQDDYWSIFDGRRWKDPHVYELYGLPVEIVHPRDIPYPGWEIVLPRNHRNIPVNLDHKAVA